MLGGSSSQMRAILKTGENFSLEYGKKLRWDENALGPKKKAKLTYVLQPFFSTEIIWSFQERLEPKVTPNINILSRNSNELESREISGRFLSTRLEIR